MKQAPMTITPVLLAVLIVSAVAGALTAMLVLEFGISGWLGLFCAAFIPVPIGGIIRASTAAALGTAQGIYEPVPVAGPLAIRLGIGVVVAAIVAAVLNQAGQNMPFGALSGALAALITSIVLVMAFSVMMSKNK